MQRDMIRHGPWMHTSLAIYVGIKLKEPPPRKRDVVIAKEMTEEKFNELISSFQGAGGSVH